MIYRFSSVHWTLWIRCRIFSQKQIYLKNKYQWPIVYEQIYFLSFFQRDPRIFFVGTWFLLVSALGLSKTLSWRISCIDAQFKQPFLGSRVQIGVGSSLPAARSQKKSRKNPRHICYRLPRAENPHILKDLRVGASFSLSVGAFPFHGLPLI